MLYPIKKFIKSKYQKISYSLIAHKVDFNPENTITLFSDPRGGSTWLTEAIATIDNTAVLWEPLAITHNKGIFNLKFGWRQYIPENEQWEAASLEFKKILQGKGLNHWTGYFSSAHEFVKAEELIVKFCRGNALLPWFVKQFNLKYLPIYLIRHPFAVISSQMKQGGWNGTSAFFEIPSSPFNEIYSVHKLFLDSLKTKEEVLLATWCITNKEVLNNPNNNQSWVTVTYEELLLYPEDVVKQIFRRWDRSIPFKLLSQLKTQSSTTIDGSNVNNSISQLSSWKKYFDETQIDKMQSVLDYFEITLYSKESIVPSKFFQVEQLNPVL